MSVRKMQDIIIAAIGLGALGYFVVKKIRSYITKPAKTNPQPVTQQIKDKYHDL